MKNAKKIIPALAMLLVSAVMLSTASFAWFAMSSDVNANNMMVTLQSNSTYLLIDTESSMTGAQASVDGVVDSSFNEANVLPVAHNTFTVNDGSTASSVIETANNWYTCEGQSNTNGAPTKDESNQDIKTPVETEKLKNYVRKYTYYVAMAANTTNDGKNLKVTKLTIESDGTKNSATMLTPIKVIVACGGNIVELSNTDTTGSTAVLATTVGIVGATGFAATQIDVYVFYDGNDSDLTTANFDKIANAKISFQLSVE